MWESHSITLSIITLSVKPAEGDEDADNLSSPNCTVAWEHTVEQAQTSFCLIIQPSHKPHIDDNESLSVASSSIEPDPVCVGGTAAEAHPLYL